MKRDMIIAAPQGFIRETISNAFSQEFSDVEISLADNFKTLLANLSAESLPLLCLLNIDIPGFTSWEELEELCAEFPDLKVAIIAQPTTALEMEAAYMAGAQGFLPLDLSVTALIDAVRFMLNGQLYIPPCYVIKARHARQQSPYVRILPLPDVSLDETDKYVLYLLSRGRSNKEISDELDVQLVTIKARLQRIYQKLGIKNRTQAARFALEHGLHENPKSSRREAKIEPVSLPLSNGNMRISVN